MRIGKSLTKSKFCNSKFCLSIIVKLLNLEFFRVQFISKYVTKCSALILVLNAALLESGVGDYMLIKELFGIKC